MQTTKQFICVAIYLKGYELNPEYVTQMIGVQPSKSQKKGGLKPNSTRFVAKIGMWMVDVESRTLSVSELIDELLQKIGNPSVRLDEIKGVEDAFLDIFVPLSKDGKINEPLEFALTKNQITKLNQLGLSVEVTVS